jgi:hypothetical protein
MTEAEWLTCTDPERMLDFLCRQTSERKLRLFAVACCRRVWHLLADERSRQGVEVAERYADEDVTVETLHAARREAIGVANSLPAPPGARSAERRKMVAYAAGRAAASGHDALASAGEVVHPTRQRNLVRCIFGNPFRPSSLHRAWLTPSVLTLAQAAYEERILPTGEVERVRLAVLADALEEAGCADADLLGHLRGPGPHVRGCWAVDLVLSKQPGQHYFTSGV